MNDTARERDELIAALSAVASLLRNRSSEEELRLVGQDRHQVRDLVERLQVLLGDPHSAGRDSDGFHEVNLRNARLDLVWQWELERAALANSLRVGTGQLLANTIAELSACRMLLNSSPVDEVQPGLKALEDELRVELAEFQTLLCDLNSPLDVLPELGLYACLRLYVKGCARRHGVWVKLLHDDAPLRLPQKLQVVIYRMIQVAVKQAQVWRGASEIEVHLSRQEQELVIRVADNGSDTSLASQFQSAFLDLDKLAELVGADLSRETLETGNTLLLCRIPVSA